VIDKSGATSFWTDKSFFQLLLPTSELLRLIEFWVRNSIKKHQQLSWGYLHSERTNDSFSYCCFRCQFHQNYTHAFFVQMLFRRIFLVTCKQKKLLKQCSYVKRARFTLMKLTAGVNFMNVLQAAFVHKDPKSAKRTGKLTVFFCAFRICVHKSC